MGDGGVILANQASAFEAVLWMAGLLLALIVAAAFLGWYRSRLRRSMSASRRSFSLEDLRAMRDRGDLNASEYERLRAAAIADFGAAAKDAP